MNEVRMGEIALLLLRDRTFREGVRISSKLKREINSNAKRLGLDPQEATDFAEALVRETVDRIFPKK